MQVDPKTRIQILRALAQKNADGDPALTQRQIAARYRLNERTVQRIFRKHHCDHFEVENAEPSGSEPGPSDSPGTCDQQDAEGSSEGDCKDS